MATWLDCKLNEHFPYKSPMPEDRLVGVEVELEGRGINVSAADPKIQKYWNVVADGSLRGEAFEAVLRMPMSHQTVNNAVTILYDTIATYKGIVNDSMRAGVHVHLNCQHLTLRQLYTFMAAYFCLEDLLTEDLGEEREGNLFCLRLSDAEEINLAIHDSLSKGSLKTNQFTNDNLRYAAMNMVSLSKFGSLEFRALRTPTTPGPILDWVGLLVTLYHNSKNYANPRALLEAMSANGDREVVQGLLGPYAAKIIGKEGFEKKLYASIRSIQSWVYLNNWESK